MEPTILSVAVSNIKKFEGCKLKAYKDSVGIWTIGYGHIKGVKAGDECSQAQADSWLNIEVREYLDAVLKMTPGPGTTRNQHAAMICLCYNIGIKGFGSSSVLRLHRLKDYQDAADAFLMWNKGTVGGKKVVIKGLTNRRTEERRIYLSDNNSLAP